MNDDEGRAPDERRHAVARRWETSGHVLGKPRIPVVSTDIYELLVGGYFIVHHVDVTVGEQPVRANENIGEPDAVGAYLARRRIDANSLRRLNSALALCVGAEAFVVLCGLEPDEAAETLRWAASALVTAARS